MRDNIQELLKPRVRCIASDTSGDFEVGEIFYAEQDGRFYMYGDNGRWIFYPDKYPHLFRRLEWWEDRDVKDMPEYVRFGDWDKAHMIYKIKEYNPTGFESYPMCAIGDGKNVKDYFLPHLNRSFPATSTDYLNQTPKPKI